MNSQPCVLISSMGVGSINQHFSLQLPQNPYVTQAQCQEISQLLSYSFLSPNLSRVLKAAAPGDAASSESHSPCVWDDLEGLFQHK